MSQTVKCPECGAVQRDLWDYNWSGNSEDKVVNCGSCDAEYVLSVRVDVEYEAHRLPPGDHRAG